MSRNRCDTECDCGFWKFIDVRELPIDDPDLMTEDAYFHAIGWDDCSYKGNGGYGWGGYRDRPDDYAWRSKTGGWTNRTDCPGPDYVREVTRYQPTLQEDRNRWRKLECPICRRLYAGWYVRQPHEISPRPEKPKYELYDSSYYYAFNDEPSDRDLENLIDWKPNEIADALRAWRKTR